MVPSRGSTSFSSTGDYSASILEHVPHSLAPSSNPDYSPETHPGCAASEVPDTQAENNTFGDDRLLMNPHTQDISATPFLCLTFTHAAGLVS